MTINTENPSKMVLQDKKRSAYLGACGIIVMGLLIASLLIRHGVMPILFGLLFMGAGAFFLFLIKRVTIELDRASGSIHILLEGLKSKEERNLPMAQVQKLLLRKVIQTHTTHSNTRMGSDIRRTSSTTTYHLFILVFVTSQNEEIPFQFGKVRIGLMSMLTTPETKIQENARAVANFLNVPLTVAEPPSAGQVFGAFRQGLPAGFQRVH
jgi:hypothetical protein